MRKKKTFSWTNMGHFFKKEFFATITKKIKNLTTIKIFFLQL